MYGSFQNWKQNEEERERDKVSGSMREREKVGKWESDKVKKWESEKVRTTTNMWTWVDCIWSIWESDRIEDSLSVTNEREAVDKEEEEEEEEEEDGSSRIWELMFMDLLFTAVQYVWLGRKKKIKIF